MFAPIDVCILTRQIPPHVIGAREKHGKQTIQQRKNGTGSSTDESSGHFSVMFYAHEYSGRRGRVGHILRSVSLEAGKDIRKLKGQH